MRKTNLTLALLLTASTLALTGCSRNPVAPEVNAPSDPGAGTTVVGGHTEDQDPGVVGEGGATRALHVEANEAGVLTVGRWTVTIHKNSHLDAATVAMTVTDPEAMEVQIEVTPASANVFQVPIELTADCSDQVNLVPSENGIFVWNGAWTWADDQTSQDGSLIFKAKTIHLTSAKVGTLIEVVKGKGK